MYSSGFIIDSCTFINNKATTLSNNIFAGFSKVLITSTSFLDSTNVGKEISVVS